MYVYIYKCIYKRPKGKALKLKNKVLYKKVVKKIILKKKTLKVNKIII